MTSMVSWLLGARAGGLDPLDDRYYDVRPGGLSRTGVYVSAESAMKQSAVYRCVSIVANALAMFPKGMFERLARGRREAPEHPLDAVIGFKPNRRQNAFVFWRQICYDLILRQNAFCQIVQGAPGRGWVGGLVPLHPDRVSGPDELSDGTLRYVYTRANGERVPMIGDIDIWHLTGLSTDGLRGLSMLSTANDSIGLALAAERHAARFFERGVKPTGVLQHEKTLLPETAREMGESFGRLYGGESGTGKIPVLWEGMKFVPAQMSLKDAEFLDSRKFSVADIARWFGVPPHLVGDVERSTSWGTGIEQQGLGFLVYCLQPWVTLIESSIHFSLVVQPDRYYPKCNTSSILRMDQKAQAEVMALLIDKGVLNPNECRELLERNPREGGDEYSDPAGKVAAVEPPAPHPAEPPAEQPADPPSAAAVSRAVATATSLARSRATELLEEEAEGLTKLAKEHAAKPSGWPGATARWYGHFAGRVAQAMAVERTAAKAWCDGRRDLVQAEGLAGLGGDRSVAENALVVLALEFGG